MSQHHCRLRAIALFGFGSICFSSAFAQTSPTPSSAAQDMSAQTLEEIVVTARSRAERLQDVPIAIDVIPAQTIQDVGVKSLIDLSALAPSFIYAATQRGQATISMRGLSPNTYATNRQGVSFFIDGMYVPGEVTSINLQDIDHMEVLEGPQATHFGRGTYAGAINFITKMPTSDTPSGYIEAETSSYSSYDVSGTLNTPIVSDQLFGSFSVHDFRRGSLYNDGNTQDGAGWETTQNYAANFLWLPLDGTSVKVRTSYDRDHDGNPAGYTLYRQDMAQYDETFPSGKTYPVFTLNSRQPQLIGYELGPYEPTEGRDRQRKIANLFVDQDLWDVATLHSAFGYFHEYSRLNQDLSNRWYGDPTLIGAHPSYDPIENKTESFSYDVRVTSSNDSAWKWTVGAYYYDSTYDSRAQFGKITLGTTIVNPIYPPSTTGLYDTDNVSGYGSLGYEFLPGLSLTAEGRYQRETVGYEGCNYVPANPSAGNCQNFTAPYKRSDNDFLPRVTLDYKAADNILLYALYSVGVKSGAINATSSAANLAADLAYEKANAIPPETAQNYEFGWKTELFDKRVVLNGAAFHMDVSHQQVTSFYTNTSGVLVAATTDGGSSTINGVELTTAVSITPDWDVNGSFAHIHQEFTSEGATTTTLANLFGAGSPQASLKGRTTVKTPHWTANASTEYRIPAIYDWKTALRLDVQYVGDRFADQANYITLPAYEMVEVSARFERGDTAITGFVKNLLNQRNPIDAAEGYGDLAETGARAYATPSIIVYLPEGRQFGIRLDQKF